MSEDTAKSIYLEDKERLVREFGVKINESIRDRLRYLYPNEIAIENYIRGVIFKHLDKIDTRSLKK